MDPSLPTVNLTLWRADAIVLFDWLMTVDEDDIPTTHPAQRQALLDLLTRFEMDTDVVDATGDQILAAQEDVARDMGV